jgi:hypothetical protein
MRNMYGIQIVGGWGLTIWILYLSKSSDNLIFDGKFAKEEADVEYKGVLESGLLYPGCTYIRVPNVPLTMIY